MTERDPLRASQAPGERSELRYVAAPTPHAGIGRALRHSFAPRAAMPDEIDRLLGRLR